MKNPKYGNFKLA